MNVYDAERMGDLAAKAGYRETALVEDAELIVLNTCHIRERAGYYRRPDGTRAAAVVMRKQLG